MLTQIQEQGGVRNFETQRRTKSGEILTTLLSADVIYVRDERHLLCVHKDITGRKRMEEALRLSEERFSKAFNASPVSMTITTFEDGRIIAINDNFRQLIGLTNEEIIGRTTLDINLWNPSQRHNIKQHLEEFGFISEAEGGFSRITGEPRLLIYSAERINIDGEELILSAFTDVTQQKQMEAEMQRLDRLNLVGEMAASIGHEIRNPMTSVRGFLQMFMDKYSEDKEFLDIMIDELDRANAIITEFLSLAKNKLIELKPENLNLILNSILPMVKASARIQDKNIRLETQDLPDLLVDEKEIRQLILNMVRNGLESMPSGGFLTIKTFRQGDNVILSIKDQGRGIEPGVLDKLGTPFFTTKEQGTGLGLAVCYGIAKRHNAKITIDTTSNGTTFNIWFAGHVSN
jgi:PAS domain S-box-containing protein